MSLAGWTEPIFRSEEFEALVPRLGKCIILFDMLSNIIFGENRGV